MQLRKSWIAACALALCALAAEGRARADLLRCTGPDGRTIYTDDKAVCPDAKPYQPEATVHSVTPGPASAADARKNRALQREQVEGAKAGEAQSWKQRRLDKEEELRQVVAEHASLKDWVSFCNRGNIVFTRDSAGIPERIRCNDLNKRLAALDERAEGIRTYLNEELPDECRRAGCLPGWIR